MHEASTPTLQRFGPEFVEGQRARYGHRPPQQRQLTYDNAVNDEYEPWRAWLDEQLDLLEPAQAQEQAGRVWLDEGFWTVFFEMAVGAHLRSCGFRVAYEREIDGLTPDWTILTPAGDPAGLVEVHTDNPTREIFGQMRAWHGLVQRIKTIPVSVVLMLAPSARRRDRAAQRVEADLPDRARIHPGREPLEEQRNALDRILTARPPTLEGYLSYPRGAAGADGDGQTGGRASAARVSQAPGSMAAGRIRVSGRQRRWTRCSGPWSWGCATVRCWNWRGATA